jgi:mxaJ protein
MVAATTPMFRSAYVIVYRKDSGLNITSLNDTTLKHLRIGVNLLNADAENTPPAMALSAHGVVGTLVGFPTFYSDSVRPNDIIDAVVNKTVDLAIVWGPLAGYFARQAKAPLVLNPIEFDSLTNTPFAFDISMGVRKSDVALRDSLQKLLDTHHDEVQGILKQFGVPLLPIPPADSTKSHPSVRPAAPSAPPARR